MKRFVMVLLLLAALLVCASSGADLTLSTGQKDYYFVVGADAQIPVTVSNTYDHPLQGTLRSTTTESTQGPGLSMSSSYSQSQLYMAPKGDSTVTVDGGTSDAEKTLTFTFSFDYTDTTPQSQVLEDITLHFVKDQSQVKNTQQQVVSQSGTPDQGGVTLSSSQYQSIQSIQQMMQQSSGLGLRQSSQDNQMPQDTSALKQQLEAEQKQAQANKDEFEKNLNKDPTFSAVNQSLTSQGYAVSKTDSNPQSGNTGTFSREYSKPTGESVSVKGSLKNGTSTEITEQSTAPINPGGPLPQNTSYQESGKGLENEGYNKSQTTIKNTPAGITVNQSYQNSQGKPAYLNATSTGSNVTSVTVEKEKVENGYLLPIVAIVIIALLAIIGYLVYRKYEKNRPVIIPAPVAAPKRVVDYRNEAELLLRKAEKLAGEQCYREAYGTVGQALRLFLSYRFGTGTEMTNTEIITLVAGSGREIAGVEDLLERCSLIEFAKAEPEPGEFEKFTGTIRNIIRVE